MRKIVLIDHYDSFTYTIKNYLETLNTQVQIVQNDDPCLKKIEELAPTHLILSPGPGNPNQSGYTLNVIKKYHKKYPILGICLGHQSLMQAFGAKIVVADEIMHGKSSLLTHTGEGLFAHLPQHFNIARYHSLIVDLKTLPDAFKLTGWTYDKKGQKIIMAVQHLHYPLFGVQYHPEAVLTEHGLELLRKFIA